MSQLFSPLPLFLFLLLNILLIAGFYFLNKSNQLLPADIIGSIVLILSINLIFSLFGYLQYQSELNKTWLNIINDNKGIWTFAAMCIAAIAIYINARMKQYEDRKEELERRDSASKNIQSSLKELIHNLQHFAHEINDNNKFITFPATTLETTFGLSNNTEISLYCAPSLIERIKIMQRITSHNKSMLRSISELDSRFKIISFLDDVGICTFSTVKFFKQISQPNEATTNIITTKPPLDFIHFDERIATHSIQCIIDIATYHPEAAKHILKKPEFKWLSDYITNGLGGYYYSTKSSNISEKDAARIRTKKILFICWINDKPIDNVTTVAVRTTFRDIVHNHRHS